MEVFSPIGASGGRKDGALDMATSGSSVILLLDDERDLRRLWRFWFERAGYCILDTDNNDEALAMLEGNPRGIHLVISDFLRPLGHCLQARRVERAPESGLRFYKEILRVRFPHIPVVFCTGYSEGYWPAFSGAEGVPLRSRSKGMRLPDYHSGLRYLFRMARVLGQEKGVVDLPHGFILQKPCWLDELERAVEIALRMWSGAVPVPERAPESCSEPCDGA
jgi:CheY-like chemotaxis protein